MSYLSKEELLARLETLIHNPWAMDEEIEHVFLELMAEDLLGTGQAQFQCKGRGALMFDLRGLLGWRRGGMPTMYYLSYPDLVKAGHTSKTTESEINEYNPENEVPVMFVYDYATTGRVISRGWNVRASKN
jgi:hypothetical protein